MLKIAFWDNPINHLRLQPLTFTKPSCELRVGILTIKEKWEKHFNLNSVGYFTLDYLAEKYKSPEPADDLLIISGNILPSADLILALTKLTKGEGISIEGEAIAFRADTPLALPNIRFKAIDLMLQHINYTWDLYLQNGDQIRSDFILLTQNRISQKITDPYTMCYGNEIFLEPGATVKAAILNAENGPIYIGKNGMIGEGSIIKGPFALNEQSELSMGAKIRGDVTIGPYSKAGGEISTSVIQGYSSKGHDGFLGHSVIGEWCNLGAGTNNSNLKNNYSSVKMWRYDLQAFDNTGLQFCGLIMGDHSKCAISTTFNTGTSIGVGANIFGPGLPRTIIPSFAWGGFNGFVTHHLDKMFESADLVMKRRSRVLDRIEKNILIHVFEQTNDERIWQA